MLPLDFEGQKPICIVSETYQKQVERIQTFAIFDNVKSKEFSAKPWNSQMCSTYVGTELDQNQLCVENPPGMSQTNEISGDILVNKIMVSAKQYIVLLGVISFSTEDIQILTNVMTHTKWIASKINLN
ncbi:uncharacterized protein LOC123038154 [Drosophila rhopaloa]|uniref:Peptidase S1 domain-containing protein n=1 Tax=Drosophila rhopaloa TaxID=1041015 RepID=A0ABM5JGP0_DRORH|nr:uncharacterized protein LOC123038154 [Drosophila rhopaloa]